MPDVNELPELKILISSLQDYSEGKMKRRDFMEVHMRWSYEFAFLRGLYMPGLLPSKPTGVSIVDSMSKEEFKNLSEPAREEYKRRKLEWLDEQGRIRHANMSDWIWLNKMASYYKYRGDRVKVTEIEARIKNFNGLM